MGNRKSRSKKRPRERNRPSSVEHVYHSSPCPPPPPLRCSSCCQPPPVSQCCCPPPRCCTPPPRCCTAPPIINEPIYLPPAPQPCCAEPPIIMDDPVYRPPTGVNYEITDTVYHPPPPQSMPYHLDHPTSFSGYDPMPIPELPPVYLPYRSSRYGTKYVRM